MANQGLFKKTNHARLKMSLMLMAVDFLAILIFFTIAVVGWNIYRGQIDYQNYISLIPFLTLFIVAFAMLDLYPGVGKSPITTFRSIIIATSLSFLLLAVFTFITKSGPVYSRGAFLVWWILCLLFLPAIRRGVVLFLARHGKWGEPVVLIGITNRTPELIETLREHPEYGLLPNSVLTFQKEALTTPEKFGIPVFYIPDLIESGQIQKIQYIPTAIVFSANNNIERINAFIQEYQYHVARMVVIPENIIGSLWVMPLDFGGILGYEVQQNLLNATHRAVKRVSDLLLILLASPLVIPVGLLIALAIKLDSKGPVFYSESRIGYGGQEFKAYKFRTMVKNARELLEKYLDENPELQQEWQDNHKLKHDPRITGVGRILRRLSLDELPQLYNILKNEMSLVGPRPIVAAEIEKYGSRFDLYKQVKPGLSGLWQVSGRNVLTYKKRVDLDEYYVRNYSIWMDFYILRNTIDAVLSNRGAY